MARSSQSFNKREKEKQKAKERQEKKEKMEERKANAKKGQSLEDMMAYIDENGKIYDATEPYTEDTRVWTIKNSAAPPTFYVKYGDWLAWMCSIASLILLILSFSRKEISVPEKKEVL